VNKMNNNFVKKSKFAQMCNVSAGRVSQWIAEGKIGPEALVGEGQRAKINVQLAFEHLKERLDSNQRFSLNGLSTKLNGDASPAPRKKISQPDVDADDDDLESRVRLARSIVERLKKEDRASQDADDEPLDALRRVASASIRLADWLLIELSRDLIDFGLSDFETLNFLQAEYHRVREQILVSRYVRQPVEHRH
jgi:hypothetical protein